MLYQLALWIRSITDVPGINLFSYVTFRAASAAIFALLISFIVGPRIIAALKRRQVGEQA